MNKKIVNFYLLPLVRSLIDEYLTRYVKTDLYASQAESLYKFYEWIYQETQKPS